MKKSDRIFVAGHRGLVGSSLLEALQNSGYDHIIVRSREELDLTRQEDVEHFFKWEKPDYVILAAAKVGGILANDTYPGDFIYQNLAIQTNVIRSAYTNGVQRLLFLGSSCIYPRECPQPIKESYLLAGPLEKTNEAYAIAKIAGIELCKAYNKQYGTKYLAVMPTNLYGPNDNYDLATSHVVPALIRRFHEAKVSGSKTIALWGTGTPRREFLYVEDLAEACVFLLCLEDSKYESLLHADSMPIINIGCGQDISISQLSQLLSDVVGTDVEIDWDSSKPDGTPQKMLDVSKMTDLGWTAKTNLNEGLKKTYDWYCKHL